MSVMASQITGAPSICSTACSGADQRRHQSSSSLAFVRGFPSQRVSNAEMFPFDDVIMVSTNWAITSSDNNLILNSMEGPGPHQRGPALYQRYIRKTGQNFQKPWSRGLPQALQHLALHPGPPQRQDTWSQKVRCRLWNPVSRMPCPVCRWNCPHTGDKDERPPKTEVSTNSCGRPWTPHQNGRCQSDRPWGQYVATQDELLSCDHRSGGHVTSED